MRAIYFMNVLGVGLVSMLAGGAVSAAPPTIAPALSETVKVQMPAGVTLATPEAYDAMELPPTSQWPESVGLAMGPSNKVGGYVRNAAGTSAAAVVWTNGQPALVAPPGCYNSVVHAFDPNGVPVGTCGTTSGFIGTSMLAGTLVFGAGPSGKYVGKRMDRAWVNPAGPPPAALATPPGSLSVAFAMNSGRAAVGYRGPAEGPAQILLWSPNGIPSALPFAARAYAINDSNVIVGRVGQGGAPTERAAKWQGNQITLLGTFGGRSGAADVNNAGVAVGWSYDADGDLFAFIHKDGKMTNLNALVHRALERNPDGTWRVGAEWVLQAALGINDAGYICGYGTKEGKRTAFVLKPRTGGATVLSAADIKRLATAVKPSRALVEAKEALPNLEPARTTP